MTQDITQDKQFQTLEKEYKFLARARGESLDSLEYIILDVETTGLEPTQDELTEIGALKTKGKELQTIFSELIKPKTIISPQITQLTGIDNEMVKDSPPAQDVLPRFAEFIGDVILVAHNAEFDLSFIKHYLKKLNNLEITNSIACTVRIGRFLLPNLQNHKLHTIASHFGFKVENRHRAIGDAEITFQVWNKFIDMLKEKGIVTKRDLDSLVSRL
jgi:DNA polymerase-3 subunit alpha (Gram-positive type)